MGYFEHLKELLRPLGLYDLSSGAGRAELYALGCEMDRQQELMEILEREAVPARATGYGLGFYEEIMPFVPACHHAEERRAAIAALLRIDDMSFTAAALNGTVAGCGMDAEIREGTEAETILVTMKNTRGVPDDFSGLKERIEQILPCHLEPVYKFIYSSWSDIMAALGSWNAIEAKALDWKSFEIYIES